MNPFKLILKPIGCLFSLLSGVAVLLVIALALLYWLAESWSPDVLAEWMEQHSGFVVRADDASLELFSQRVAFEDIVVENPDAFPEKRFMRIRRLAFKLPYADIAAGSTYAREAELDIETLTIVIPPDGTSNVSVFIDKVNRAPTPMGSIPENAPTLDSFRISIDEIIIENYSFQRPDIQKLKLNYVGEFSGVSRASEVFPEVQHQLRELGLPGLSPAFFEAFFATLPIQCFADIKPLAPDIIGNPLNDAIDEGGANAKKALESL